MLKRVVHTGNNIGSIIRKSYQHTVILNNHNVKALGGFRLMATDADLLEKMKVQSARKPLPRTTVYDWSASKLITAIRNKDYDRATELVVINKVPVDSHTFGENTALTDAASRGDSDGIRFLITKLKANPYASCDCPSHNTAFHYAAKGGHTKALRTLLSLTPNCEINIMNNKSETPYDIAKDDATRRVLLEGGGKSQFAVKSWEHKALLPR
jgi:hypothetical protein